MNREHKKLLKLFQSDFNRSVEERFAQTLAERLDLRLFFINENEAFTDGRNIIVDPAMNGMFMDRAAAEKTERLLGLGDAISGDPWLALRMVTRALTIHETLHILYSDFPPPASADARATTVVRKRVLGLIHNIIEDVYIEAVGCTVYDNLETYLAWFRTMQSVLSREPDTEEPERPLEEPEVVKSPESPSSLDSPDSHQPYEPPEPSYPPLFDDPDAILEQYLQRVIAAVLYPLTETQPVPPELAPYLDATIPLYLEGSICPTGAERFAYAQRIFDLIEPLLEDVQDLPLEALIVWLPGTRTHEERPMSMYAEHRRGQAITVIRRLFTAPDGAKLPGRDLGELLDRQLTQWLHEKKLAHQMSGAVGFKHELDGGALAKGHLHKGIRVEIAKENVNPALRTAYNQLAHRYRRQIVTYRQRIFDMLKIETEVREERQWLGSGISSRHMADAKGRYWYRTLTTESLPQMAVLIMIDGSGSMDGERRQHAMHTALILHEVLKGSVIAHAIIEHRAIYDEPLVQHNILLDFQATEIEKLNIMRLQADEGTRDGLSLLWAESYLREKTQAEHRLIIALSDGVPEHETDRRKHFYRPPISQTDTGQVVRRIQRRGTQVMAIALEEEFCYVQLKKIYPSVVYCEDLERLAGQVLGVVAKWLRRS